MHFIIIDFLNYFLWFLVSLQTLFHLLESFHSWDLKCQACVYNGNASTRLIVALLAELIW